MYAMPTLNLVINFPLPFSIDTSEQKPPGQRDPRRGATLGTARANNFLPHLSEVVVARGFAAGVCGPFIPFNWLSPSLQISLFPRNSTCDRQRDRSLKERR